MNDKTYIDTNILIYLYSESEKQKQKTACEIVDSHICVTSTQALNEASNVWSKRFGWDGPKIKLHLDNIELICNDIVLVQRNTIDMALNLVDLYKYSYYDCLMLASALESNCTIIYTEDMQDRQLINGKLKIVNPFK